MDRKPMHTARSLWRTVAPSPDLVELLQADELTVAHRNVNDGQLRMFAALEPIGWHLSISHVDHQGRPRRYPTWDEIADARDTFLPAALGFVMHLPPATEYVAVHDTTFHLHQHPPAPTPTSSTWLRGYTPAEPAIIDEVHLESVAIVANPLRPEWTLNAEEPDGGDAA